MVPMGASRHRSNKHVFLIFHPYWKPSLWGQLMVLCPAASASLLSSYFWSAEMASSKKTLGSLELEDVRKSRIVRHSRSGIMEPVVAHFTAGISSGLNQMLQQFPPCPIPFWRKTPAWLTALYVAGMLITGSINTLSTKLQFQLTSIGKETRLHKSRYSASMSELLKKIPIPNVFGKIKPN